MVLFILVIADWRLSTDLSRSSCWAGQESCLFQLRVFFQSREADFSPGAEFLAKLLNARVKSSALHREDVLCRNVRRYVRSVSFNGIFFSCSRRKGQISLNSSVTAFLASFTFKSSELRAFIPDSSFLFSAEAEASSLFPLTKSFRARPSHEKPL